MSNQYLIVFTASPIQEVVKKMVIEADNETQAKNLFQIKSIEQGYSKISIISIGDD